MLLAAIGDSPGLLSVIGGMAADALSPLLKKAEKAALKYGTKYAKKGIKEGAKYGKKMLRKVGINWDGPGIGVEPSGVDFYTSGFAPQDRALQEIAYDALETALLPTGQLVPFPMLSSSARVGVG
jgi:hypothetical protein